MRLIDADAFIAKCGHWYTEEGSETGYIGELKHLIEKQPTIQPEIVRCKDCKYARLTDDGSCKYCDIWFPDEAEYMDGDYYCASAERKRKR